ncbi:putative ABC substrate-binding protein-iron [Mycoplasma haemofelis Ohio2]|uniref:Putative ABC substrate-binding protein-iron n=1 Tax=Mycoplasma haemofelis (strain Ohio2) TaxID=859194 RepID=F6FGM6_MYCHI|nr:putative ABC substrate-binding protein-iron [Mycoplasma haemofelis Ohio2]
MLQVNRKLLIFSGSPFLGFAGFLRASDQEIKDYKIMVNYNGQADLLLSLQIPPDYYPYQFKKTALYDYLTDVDQYVITNAHTSNNKSLIKVKLQSRLDELLGKVKEFGPSLWNEGLYDSGLVFRNDQFWSNKRTSVLFLEQFVADDHSILSSSFNLLPTHKDLIVTNYRAARDPYTIFSKKVFKCFESSNIALVSDKAGDDNTCDSDSKKIADKLKEYVSSYNKESINSLYRFGRYIDFWNKLFSEHSSQLNELKIEEWIKKDKLFSLKEHDEAIAKKYANTVFTTEEINNLNSWNGNGGWKSNYLSTLSTLSKTHHPALEQTTIPGEAPLAEGAQKEVVIFLFQFAALLDKYSKGNNFQTEFKDDYRKEFIQNALKNAATMGNNLKTRITNIRNYFKKIGVVDNGYDPSNGNNSNSKSLAILTYPPTSYGAGEATIQSMSKFPFIYSDIGLRQVFPKDIETTTSMEDDIFSVDDNGWWWKIGKADLDPSHLLKFEGTADNVLILANPEDWSLLKDKNSSAVKSIGNLLKNRTSNNIDPHKVNTEGYPVKYNKYHLWNEGLRSPIALNLLLDSLVDMFQKWYDKGFSHTSEYCKAMDWGDYWHQQFVEGRSAASAASASQ